MSLPTLHQPLLASQYADHKPPVGERGFFTGLVQHKLIQINKLKTLIICKNIITVIHIHQLGRGRNT